MIKKKFKFLSLLLILPIFTLVLSGCGKSVSQMAGEKAAEKMIENQMGGKADIDVDGGNVKINTKEGSIEAGDDVKLPTDFPNDVYVIDGKIVAAMSDQANKGFTVSIEINKSLDEAFAIYQDEFKKQDWKITGTMNFGESASIAAEKDNRTASVFISKSDDKTTVILGAGIK
ncbi:MAG: hypothetical protein WC349_00960 [Patescibacteria group bacterium]|jgi:hypothetical protein